MIRFIYLFIIAYLFLQGCVKMENNIEVRFRKIPIMNCLFNSDSVWRINLTFSPTSSTGFPEPILNAEVRLFEQGSFIEELQYRGNGNYISALGQKPFIGKEYEVRVQIAGYPLLTAKDSIPLPINISGNTTDTIPFTFSYNPFIDPASVFSCKITLSDPELKSKYYMIRPSYYLKEELTLYSITTRTFDSLRLRGMLTHNDSVKLSKITGLVFIGISTFKKALDSLFSPAAPLPVIYQYSWAGTSATYQSSFFNGHPAYVTDIQFKQISDYYFLLFAEKSEAQTILNKEVNILLNYYPGGAYSVTNGQIVKKDAHYFLDITTLNKAGFLYFSTYVQNITNRGNPFTEPVNTFTNINNGYGIFAGVHVRRERVW